MFTRWATPKGGFWGLLLGTLASLLHRYAYSAHLLRYGSDMSANFYGAMAGWAVALVTTTVVSAFTEPRPFAELQGLIFERSRRKLAARDVIFGPIGLSAGIAIACIGLNWWLR